MHLQFHYGANLPFIRHDDAGLHVGLTNAALKQSIETWAVPTGKQVKRGHFHLVESDESILGAASVEVRPGTLAATTQSLYDELLAERPEFSLYRVWHFVPHINDASACSPENYKTFCRGRALAFEKYANDERCAKHANTPAASAVGTQGEHLTMVYLAGRAPSDHIENPRQTPAYGYPEKYGTMPPTFARATTVRYNGKPTLFISGTASILASESIGDTIEDQLATTLENLRVIAAQASASPRGKRRVRVYLRHAMDYDYVKDQLDAHYLNDGDEAFYIVADICRQELLVEIEATIQPSPPGG